MDEEWIAENYPLEPPHFFFAVKELADRCLKYDLNALVIIVGEQGAGKSSLSLRMAEMLREWGLAFKPERDIFFDIKEFVREAGEEKRVYILEEAGVHLYSRNFMTKVNKVLSYITQTIRFKNSVTIMNLPHLKLIDKNQRMLMTHVWRTEAIILRDGSLIRVASAFRPKVDYITDRVGLKPLTIHSKARDTWIPVQNVRWKMPEKETWDLYIQLKRQYWEEWRKKWAGESENERKPTVKELIAKELQEDPDLAELLLDPTKRWSRTRASKIEELARKYGAHPRYISTVLSSLRRTQMFEM